MSSQKESLSKVVANSCCAILARLDTGIASNSSRYDLFCALILEANIWAHSSALGMKVKYFLSKRNNSGGRQVMSLDVAKTKQAAVFSCIHVRNFPNIRRPTPPSLDDEFCEDPLNAFSISSIHKTQGAIFSDMRSALIMLCSDSPIRLLSKAPISNEISGSPNL